MKYSIDQLRQVKGIGKKTIERIIEQFDESEYVSEYDSSIHIEPDSLIQGDMLEVMNGIPDKSIDMILTDPPYLMNYRSNRRVIQDKFDHILNDVNSHDLIKNFIKQSYRVLKDNTSIYMFCSWHHIDFFKSEFEKYFNLKNVIVWNKNNHGSGDLKGSYAPKHEFILFGHKGRSLNKSTRKSDVLDFDKIHSNYLQHPTEKPIDLLEVFIENSTMIGDIVLDPFMGSGSTGVACKNTNRKFIGIELDEEYFKIAEERING